MSEYTKLVTSFYLKEAQQFARLRWAFGDVPDLLNRVRWMLIRDMCDGVRLAYSLGERRLQFSCKPGAAEDSLIFEAVELPDDVDDWLAEIGGLEHKPEESVAEEDINFL